MALLHFIILFISINNSGAHSYSLNYPARNNHIDSTSVKIGLLISKDPAGDTIGLSAMHGAEMAIRKANTNGGFNGQPFELIVRTCDGPWGVTSKQVVDFVYEDKVSGIVSSLDGQNAHLAEQVVTKAHIPLLSSRATDPTLSQANIPWFFRVTPDDRQQANALAGEIYIKRGLSHLAVLVQDTYDAKMSAKYFLKSAENLEAPIPRRIGYNPRIDQLEFIVKQLMYKDVEGIILFGETTKMLNIMVEIEDKGHHISMFGMQSLLEKSNGSDIFSPEMVVSIPHGWLSESSDAFRNKFKDAYGYRPGISAAYAFDAVSILVKAIRNAGINQDEIRKSLRELNYPHGVTGPITFDVHGNRKGGVEIAHFPGGKLTGIRKY